MTKNPYFHTHVRMRPKSCRYKMGANSRQNLRKEIFRVIAKNYIKTNDRTFVALGKKGIFKKKHIERLYRILAELAGESYLDARQKGRAIVWRVTDKLIEQFEEYGYLPRE